MTKFSPHLTTVLTEMCKRVGAEFKDVDWDSDEWYRQYAWTEEEQDDYKLWLIDYVFTNTEARKEMTTIGTKNKAQCKRFTEYFVFNYGWKFKDDGKRKTD